MMTMILPTETLAKKPVKVPPKLHIAVHIEAEVLDPEVARRKANVWLLMNAGHLLRADYPELILDKSLVWRYTVVLTSPRGGDVGKIGQIHVQAATGEVIAPESLSDELLASVDVLLARPKAISTKTDDIPVPAPSTEEMIVNADPLATC
jgi:hypothetical protein